MLIAAIITCALLQFVSVTTTAYNACLKIKSGWEYRELDTRIPNLTYRDSYIINKYMLLFMTLFCNVSLTSLTMSIVIIMYALLKIVSGVKEDFCYSPACTSHTLRCPADTVLVLRQSYFGDRSSRNTSCPSERVCRLQSDCCTYNDTTDKLIKFAPEDMKNVLKNCTRRQSCTIDIPYSSGQMFHFIRHEYKCRQSSEVQNMLCADNITAPGSVALFYSGRQREDNQALNCSCIVSSESTKEINIYSEYINLTQHSCQSFSQILNSDRLFSNRTIYIQETYQIFISRSSVPLHLSVLNLSRDPEDVLWIRFSQLFGLTPISIQCQGCGLPRKDVCVRSSSRSTEGCYDGSECSQFSLTCSLGNKIALRSPIYFGHNHRRDTCSKNFCNTNMSDECCVSTAGDKIERFTTTELTKLYKECTLETSCLTKPEREDPGNHTYTHYNYECIPDSIIMEVGEGRPVMVSTEVYLFYNGSNTSQESSVTSSCNVRTNPRDSISISILYLNLHKDNCCKVKIGSEDIAECSRNSTSLHFDRRINMPSSESDLHFNSVLKREDDFVLIKFSSDSTLDVYCSSYTTTSEDQSDLCHKLPIHDEEESILPMAIGITVAMVTLVFMVVLVVCYFVRRKSKHQSNTNEHIYSSSTRQGDDVSTYGRLQHSSHRDIDTSYNTTSFENQETNHAYQELTDGYCTPVTTDYYNTRMDKIEEPETDRQVDDEEPKPDYYNTVTLPQSKPNGEKK